MFYNEHEITIIETREKTQQQPYATYFLKGKKNTAEILAFFLKR